MILVEVVLQLYPDLPKKQDALLARRSIHSLYENQTHKYDVKGGNKSSIVLVNLSSS